MAKRSEYTINGPPAPGSSPSQLHKSLTIRRENKGATPDLRALYRHSADLTADSPLPEVKTASSGLPTTPNLPPTPPAANGDAPDATTEESESEATAFRSMLVTPINQNSPPTPDNTPPRQRNLVIKPWLGTQPSFASTRAESFKTAREEITSDEESVLNGPASRHIPRSVLLPNGHHGISQSGSSRFLRSPLTSPDSLRGRTEDEEAEASNEATPKKEPLVNGLTRESEADQETEPVHGPSKMEVPYELGQASKLQHSEILQEVRESVTHEEPPLKELQNVTVRRGPSLRDRLKVAQKYSPSASTEKFASIIGWSNNVHEEPRNRDAQELPEAPHQDNKRLSGLSTTSTIGAMVVETSPLPRRRTTLRKVQKNDSLRSASSPLPNSNRNSQSQSDSPHRLVHKKARLSNENRHSFGSEPSRSHSISSSAVLPKPEVIKVAVIPERSSSLQSSANSSKRHSLSTNSQRTHSKKPSDALPPSSWQRKRTLSESERGREKQQNLVVPPRSSSLSAPTSRSTSRANSITSEALRMQRQEAESDLRKTLDRMESERLVSSLRGSQFDTSQIDTPSKPPQMNQPKSNGHIDGGRQKSLTPGTSEWAALRPPSILETPFSQPSYQSASPELNEATAINFFPHHNRSLQLIEPNMMQESRAVREVRKQEYMKDENSSPLRNPRRPPEPPQFNVIPPSPGVELNKQFPGDQPGRRASTRRRPSQRRSESFVKSLTRGLSLKNARNKKADQELDGSLHPMWKPRAFWDDVDPEPREVGAERSLQPTRPIHNSLGLPQERTIITGPVSLVRRISERRRQNRALMNQSSHGSLQRLRASRQLYKAPILGMNLRFMGLRDLQDKLLYARQRKEDERRERRRAALRERIGANVVSQGDSRFPASNSSLVRV